MNWFVYMVKCNDSSIYTGISNNLNRRLDAHAKGNGSKYVRARLPFKLIYIEKCLSRSKAIKREYEDLFNEVYDEEHVPHLLNVPGVNKVTRGKGIPFNFSIGGETKSMDSPNQKFVAMYEIDNPEVINSKEWAIAVEKGRWSTQVRQHTYDRSHFLYEYC